MKGIIALDIDGTLTGSDHLIDPEVVDYLSLLHDQEWQLIFISGRSFSWGAATLSQLSFPYFFSCYNGAYLISMPDKFVAERHLLDRSILKQVEELCDRFKTGCVIYGGLDYQENSYFIPSQFDEATNAFFEKRCEVTLEKWIPVNAFSEVPFDKIVSIKYFAKESEAEVIADAIETELGLHVPIINDPIDSSYMVLQATHPKANKGDALENFSAICRWSGIRIAAGNDSNDLPMFQKAQLTIAMQDSPLSLRQLATVVVPGVEELGLITGLRTVISRYEKTR